MSRRLGCWLTLQAALGLTLEAHWRAFSARPGEPPRSVNHFDLRGYQGMRDDDNRTPRFVEAIERQLAASASTGRGRVVLDIGTGPFALLALAAARAGASRVFALEADGRMAAAARDAVAAATDVPAGLVEVIEGLSTQVSLPEPADLIVAEVVGNVASEEGFVATMRDARDRHAAHPSDPASFIPCAIETLGAPMSYVLHHPALGPEGFDWARVIAEDPPPHFACSYRGLQLLAEPQVLESFSLAVADSLSPGQRIRSATFTLCPDRMAAAEDQIYSELMRISDWPEEQGSDTARADTTGGPAAPASGDTAGGATDPSPSASACASVAAEIAHSMSGIGLWPRLVLHPGDATSLGGEAWPDGDVEGGGEGALTREAAGARGVATADLPRTGTPPSGKARSFSPPAPASPRRLLPPIVVSARGASGESCRSHWQTVLPLLSPTAAPVRPGDVIRLSFGSRLDADVRVPAEYWLRASWERELSTGCRSDVK